VARLPGQHKGQGLSKAFTPLGLAYWYDPDNTGYGYLTNDLGATRYPLSYIFGLAVPTSTAKGVDTQEQSRPPEVPTAALGSPIKVIYGIDRTTGDIFFGPKPSPTQSVLYVGYGFGDGECDSLVQIQREEDRGIVTLGGSPYGAYATWNFHTGGDAPGAADALLLAATGESGATFERYPGLCYLAAAYTFQTDTLPGFPRLLFTIKGRKIYDPRKDSTNGGRGLHRFTDPTTWEWTDNAPLIYTDYRTNPYFGRGTPFSMIDWKAVREAADYCDEPLSDGRKRFTINTTLGRQADHDSNEDFLRTHFRASRWFMAGGKFTFYIDRPAYSVATFDESVNCAVGRRGRHKTTDIPRAVRFNWIDPTRDYQPANAIEPKDTSINSSDPRIADYNGQGCRNPGMADSQAVYLLKKRQLDEYISPLIVPRWEGAARRNGDVVTLNIPSLGKVGYLARIIQTTSTLSGKYLFDLEPYDPNLFVDSVKTLETRPSSNLPDPNIAPPAPVVALVEEFLAVNNVEIQRIAATITPPLTYPYYSHTRVTVTPLGQPTYELTDTTSGGVFYVSLLKGIYQYTVTAIALSIAGIPSASASQIITCSQPTAEVVTKMSVVPEFVSPFRPCVTFDKPKARVRTTYPAGSWSDPFGTITSFNAGRMNDGNTSLSAGTTALGTYLQLDQGTAKTLDEVRVTFAATPSSLLIGGNVIGSYQYSDNGSSWSADQPCAAGTAWPSVTESAGALVALSALVTVGMPSHRYVRLKFDGPYNLAEVQPYSYSGDQHLIDHYEIIDNLSSVTPIVIYVPFGSEPQSAGGSVIPINQFIQRKTIGGQPSNLVSANVVTVMRDGTRTTETIGYYSLNLATGSNASAPATISTTETLSNKTLDDSNVITVKDANFTMEDDADPTKKVKFDVGAHIPTGTTKSPKIPNANELAAQDIDNLWSALQTFLAGINIRNAGGAADQKNWDTDFGAGATLAIRALNDAISSANFAIRWTRSGITITKTELAGDAEVAGTIKERGRTTPMGEWIDFTPTLSASAGTWTVGTIVTKRYMLIGKTMFIAFEIDNSNVSNAAVELQLTIPGGFNAAQQSSGAYVYKDAGGAFNTGAWYTIASNGLLRFRTNNFGTFAIAAANTYVQGIFIFEVA
jgi:hypothetical protein